mgnify:CR=1 FL=1
MNNNVYSTWLEINLGAIQNNINRLTEISGKPVMAILKANGYGHGLARVALAVEASGVNWCGVARVEEALALRRYGFKGHILVLGFTPPLRVIEAASQGVSLAVYEPELISAYSQLAQSAGISIHLHLKFETGMGRLGFPWQEGLSFTKWVKEQPGLIIEGMFTHFARADEPDQPSTNKQLERFESLITEITGTGLRPEWVHACNSAGALYFPRARFDIIRPGIALFGLHPSEQALLPDGFLPALSWKTRLVSVKELPSGHGISYGHRYVTQKMERIGVIATGYADGYRRINGNMVIVHGKKVPVIGNVCMDQCMVQLDTVPEANVGDEAVLIGSQENAKITVEEVAKIWQTVNYELVCGLADRLPRVYFSGEGDEIHNNHHL